MWVNNTGGELWQPELAKRTNADVCQKSIVSVVLTAGIIGFELGQYPCGTCVHIAMKKLKPYLKRKSDNVEHPSRIGRRVSRTCWKNA
jgi:hypothetical protein